MGLWNWIKSFFVKEQTEEDFNIEDYNYVCPKCGSKKLGYGSVISNFSQLILQQEDPQYIYTVNCMDCGFKEKDEDEKSVLRKLKMISKEK